MIINVKKQNTIVNVEKFSQCYITDGTVVAIQYANDCGEFTICLNFNSESKAKNVVAQLEKALENKYDFVDIKSTTACTIGGGSHNEKMMELFEILQCNLKNEPLVDMGSVFGRKAEVN